MSAASPRTKALVSKLGKKKYRDAYLSSHLRMFLANQIRALRGNLSQKAFGQLIGKPQSVVSRLESSDYGKVTLQTLLDIASKLDVALLIRFVNYPAFLRATDDMSMAAQKPTAYDQAEMDAIVQPSVSPQFARLIEQSRPSEMLGSARIAAQGQPRELSARAAAEASQLAAS